MMKRSEFLEVLERIVNRMKAYGWGRREVPAHESLCKAGLAKDDDTRESNPILEAVICVAFGPQDYFSLRKSEERAWEWYVEREKANPPTIAGFVPPPAHIGASASLDYDAHSNTHPPGYGHAV